jgi:hypothetical protein
VTYPKNTKAAEESEISGDAVAKYLSDYEASRLNALKHGLTAKLDPASVLQWYRIILYDPGAELPLLGEPNLVQRAALALAGAEVHLRRTLTTCDAFQAGRDPLHEELANLNYDFRFYARVFGNYDFDDFVRGACEILLPGVTKKIQQTRRAINKRARLQERYRREALSKQRTAQRAWCQICRGGFFVNPKTRNGFEHNDKDK